MSRIRNTDLKFCIPISDPLAGELERQFLKSGRLVALQEIALRAKARKLTDTEKAKYAIIQFSFVFLNKAGEPLIIRRGKSKIITTGYSILHSFSPIQLGFGNAPRSAGDILKMLQGNVSVRSEVKGLEPLTVVRNLRKGIHYYFVIFAVRFDAASPLVATSEDDAFLRHLPLRRTLGRQLAAMKRDIETKPVDNLVLTLLAGARTVRVPRTIRYRVLDQPTLRRGLFKPYDVFISHASEDKNRFVRPLVHELKSRWKLRVWFDAHCLRPGDSLLMKISEGLQESWYGTIVFSRPFLQKFWTLREAGALFGQMQRGKVVIPILHRIPHSDLEEELGLFADSFGLDSKIGVKAVAKALARRIRSRT